jgi:hypothetical protein
MQSMTERCVQTLGMSSTYQNKEKIHIHMCPEIFNLWVTAERVHLWKVLRMFLMRFSALKLKCTILAVSKLVFYLSKNYQHNFLLKTPQHVSTYVGPLQVEHYLKCWLVNRYCSFSALLKKMDAFYIVRLLYFITPA